MPAPLTRLQEKLVREELSRLKRGQFLTAEEREHKAEFVARLEQQLEEGKLLSE